MPRKCPDAWATSHAAFGDGSRPGFLNLGGHPAYGGQAPQALRSLISDEERRRQMGRAARSFVAERYSWEKNTAEMESLYGEMLEQARA